MSDEIRAPFTREQADGLNRWQAAGWVHPFTCGGNHSGHVTLVATTEGWHCPEVHCSYTQDWAHAFMADGPPLNPLAGLSDD